jgi:hypothetical protein
MVRDDVIALAEEIPKDIDWPAFVPETRYARDEETIDLYEKYVARKKHVDKLWADLREILYEINHVCCDAGYDRDMIVGRERRAYEAWSSVYIADMKGVA